MRRAVPAEPPNRRARAVPAWLRRAALLMRLLALACALQLSGSAHLIVATISGHDVECIDVCDDAPDDHRCPPGCPDCSCPHGRLPSLPPSFAPPLPEMVAWEIDSGATPYESGVPPSPPLPALDRPPRA
jgi:hypothetical protein